MMNERTIGKWKRRSSDSGQAWKGDWERNGNCWSWARFEEEKANQWTWNGTQNPPLSKEEGEGVTNPALGDMEVEGKKELNPKLKELMSKPRLKTTSGRKIQERSQRQP